MTLPLFDPADLDRRRLLFFAALLGDAGAKAVQNASQRVGKHWAKKIVTAIPTPTIRQLNKVLGHNFITKYGTTQGILVLGRELPFGAGGAGNYLLARAAIKAARGAFGPPPSWPNRASSTG